MVSVCYYVRFIIVILVGTLFSESSCACGKHGIGTFFTEDTKLKHISLELWE